LLQGQNRSYKDINMGNHLKSSWFLRVLIALDQLANVLIYWKQGSPDVTLSAHFGYRIKTGKANLVERFICRCLHWFDKEHCKKSYEYDKEEFEGDK
jgi:hypothetical protein